MAAGCYVCVVLLRLAGVVCIDCDIRLLDIVDSIFMMDAVAVALFCDQVLRTGALLLTIGLACACRLLRNLFLVIILLLSGMSSCGIVGSFSNIGTAVGDTIGTSGVSLVMFLVIRLSSSPNGCIVCTLGSAWVIPSRFFSIGVWGWLCLFGNGFIVSHCLLCWL